MSERVIPAADKMVSLSDVNGTGTASMMIESQGGQSFVHKFAPYQLKYIRSRIEAILAKFEEENRSDSRDQK